MELSYFEKALDFLMEHPQIDGKNGIGVCAISKGAEIALSMAAFLPKSKLGAVAVMNTMLQFTIMDVHYNGVKVIEGKIIITVFEDSNC